MADGFGTVTTNTYRYANFALGERVAMQEGEKTPITYASGSPIVGNVVRAS